MDPEARARFFRPAGHDWHFNPAAMAGLTALAAVLRKDNVRMPLILILVILLLIFGGGGYYMGPGLGYYGGGGLSLVLLIVILFLLFGRGRGRP
jgi:hypothetical protein